MDKFVIDGFTFEEMKGIVSYRPFRVKCIETGDLEDSAISNEDAARLIISRIRFREERRLADSQNLDFVKRMFSERLQGVKIRDCDQVVKEKLIPLFPKGLSLGDTDGDSYKIYLTDLFKITVLFDKGKVFPMTDIIVEEK